MRLKWKLDSVRLEMVLILMQDRCMVWPICNIDSKIVLDAPDGTCRFEAQEEAHFSPFGDSANLDARLVQGLAQTYHGLRNHFGCSGWNS
jgi:hypothetical protein